MSKEASVEGRAEVGAEDDRGGARTGGKRGSPVPNNKHLHARSHQRSLVREREREKQKLKKVCLVHHSCMHTHNMYSHPLLAGLTLASFSSKLAMFRC